ncbi:hypothetical protein C8Q79DRAFT_1008829 [Trametes meyenii]|nr:hypothetical protein C8Q79DRAFT_1008829 [Trametes meyenii]
MANVSSGSKRAWDGLNDADSHKRPREDPRDWRDVHLESPRRKPTPDRVAATATDDVRATSAVIETDATLGTGSGKKTKRVVGVGIILHPETLLDETTVAVMYDVETSGGALRLPEIGTRTVLIPPDPFFP